MDLTGNSSGMRQRESYLVEDDGCEPVRTEAEQFSRNVSKRMKLTEYLVSEYQMTEGRSQGNAGCYKSSPLHKNISHIDEVFSLYCSTLLNFIFTVNRQTFNHPHLSAGRF